MFLLSKRLSPRAAHGQPSSGFHPSPMGGFAGLAPQTQPQQGWKQNTLCGHSISRLCTEILGFFWMCCRNTASSSWGKQTSPPNRELVTACMGFWAAEFWASDSPGLENAGGRPQKRSGASEMNTLKNIRKNAGRRAPRESKWAETARVESGSEEMARGRGRRGKK